MAEVEEGQSVAGDVLVDAPEAVAYVAVKFVPFAQNMLRTLTIKR